MPTTFDLAIDCRLRNSTGIGRVIRELVPRIVAALPEQRILLVGPGPADPWAGALADGRVEFLPSSAAVFRQGEQRLFREVLPQARVLWCTHFCVPWSVPRDARLVTTIHDLIPWHVPAGVKGRIRQFGAWFYLRAAQRNSRLVLTGAESVRGELTREFGFAPDRIRMVLLGVAPEWKHASPGTAPAGTAAGRFVLYVGNLSPHKNVTGLLAAFDALKAAIPHRLVIVGEPRGFAGHAGFARLAQRLGDRVIFARRLTEPELLGTVAAAELLVLPSLEEGFGLPPLEAMAAGTPVLTSDCATLLETAARGAHRFRLADRDDLGVQLRRLLTDDALRCSKVEEGRAWAGQFTWERAAEMTASALREALEQP